MHRSAGGNKMNTAIGLGLTAGLFAFGIVLVTTLVVLEKVLGGYDGAEKEPPRAKPAAEPQGIPA